MKILARQLTLDLYNCNEKRIFDLEAVRAALSGVFGTEPSIMSTALDSEHYALVGAFKEGHIAIHIYFTLRYVSVDIFTCHESEESEELAKVLKQYFQPEKIKSTFLKRGDFGLEKDIMPKIITRVAPLRKVRNVSANVVKKLIRRGN